MTTEELSIATPTPAASQTDLNTVDVESKEVEAGAEGEPKAEEKPALTAAEIENEQLKRENKRMQRGIDRRTRQLAEERARNGLTQQPSERNNQPHANDSEPLSLTRAELNERVRAEALKLAPTLNQEAAEAQRRTSVVDSLAKAWGHEKFDEVSSDLDDAFGGLTERNGQPKPAVEALFEADDPAKVMEYLTDPEHVDEAEVISRMSAVQAGKAIAKLEAKLSTVATPTASKTSKALPPLEAIRGGGAAVEPDESKMTDAQWAKHQESKRNKR